MKTAKALMAVAAAVVVIVLSSSAAMAVTFAVEVSVGWINSTGTCQPVDTACLGFSGPGGFSGTSLVLNWDTTSGAADSFLRIGALPDVVGFPLGLGATTIDPGQTVRTMQIQHENNAISPEDSFLGSITLSTLLTMTGPGGVQIIGPGTGGDLNVPVTLLDEDRFTFFTIDADIPFVFGSITYILQVRGLLDGNGSPACEAAGGGTVNCMTLVGEFSDRFVAITLLRIDVPAPTSLLLIALGLVGVGALPLIPKRRSAFKGPSAMRSRGTGS
jgi:hypothetical protein